MKTKKRLLPALVVSLFAATAAPATQAAQFSGVYVFGDSLSDAGYYRPFLLSLGIPASTVSQLGRFTTSPDPIWAELVSRFYGYTPAPSNTAGGNIFAQGGARVAAASASTPPGGAQRPVSTQIDEYLARSGGTADPNALYGLWIGANDIFQQLGALQAGLINATQLQTNVLAAASAEIAQVARLQAAGARYIMVFALPDIGATPQFAGSSVASSVTALSAGYNTTLFTGLASAGVRVIPVDVFTLFGEIRANPAAFGFSNITTPACGPFPPFSTSSNAQFCLPPSFVAPNANLSYAFADGVHPTGAAQAIVAQLAESLIEGPTQVSLLAEAPLRTHEAHVRTLNEGLLQGRRAGIGRFNVFAATDRDKFQIDSGIGNTGVDNTMTSVTVGATARASESVMVGLAIGKAKNDAGFGQDAGGFRTDETTGSLFASLRSGGFYGTGILSIAKINFGDVRRNVRLGQLLRTTSASTDGSNASAYFDAGYDFSIGRLTIGPLVALSTQSITVNGFDEEGGGVAGLRIASQDRHSEVWSGGVRATYNLGNWTPWLRVTADKERRDDPRFVTATPLTMVATGSSYDIPAYAPDTNYMTTSLGIRGLVTDRVALSVGYSRVSGRSGIHDEAIGATVSIGF